MFGYIKPYKPELKIKEFAIYKAVYCTLCKELGLHYGILSRLLLNYDLSFYALVSLAILNEDEVIKRGRCTVNPFKKCTYLNCNNAVYHKAAALTILITKQKLKDDIEDESFFKALRARLLLMIYYRASQKAKRDFPQLALIMARLMAEQKAVEAKDNCQIDECAEPTARAMAIIFADIQALPNEQLKHFGYFLGKWIYTIDAIDDLADDQKRAKFNPLIRHLEQAADAKMREDIYLLSNNCITIMEQFLAQLNDSKYQSIIQNIISLGMVVEAKNMIFKED